MVPDTNLNPVELDFNSVASALMPNKHIVILPKMHTVTCGCKKNTLEDVSVTIFALYAKNFASARSKNVVPTFTSRRRRTLNKICKYKGFL